MARTPRGDSTARILEITTAVRRDLGRTWSVSQMAQLLGIKGSQLRRLCSDTIHISPAQLLRDIRYAAAASLLENPQLRVKEVLAQVGIRDGSHFCRDFRKRYGLSPLGYQSQHVRIKLDSANKTAAPPIDRAFAGPDDGSSEVVDSCASSNSRSLWSRAQPL